MSALTTRTFTLSDIPSVTMLTNELGYPTTETEMRQRMQAFLSNSDYHTIVAEKGGSIVGFIGLIHCWYWERNGCYIRIQSLVVSKEAKRSGIGKQLIDAAKDWAHERGALQLSLNCSHKTAREAAHQFYPSIGFSPSAVGYTLELDAQ